MNRRRWVCVLCLPVLLLGCGGGGGATPKATFDAFKSAMADKNFAETWEMLSAETRRQTDTRAKAKAEEVARAEGPARVALETEAKMMEMTLDDMKKMDGKAFFIGMYKLAAEAGKEEWQKISRGQFKRADIDGNTAKVYVEFEGKLDTDPLPMVLEGGKWKVELTGKESSREGGPREEK